jgi:hypothetical protein
MALRRGSRFSMRWRTPNLSLDVLSKPGSERAMALGGQMAKAKGEVIKTIFKDAIQKKVK